MELGLRLAEQFAFGRPPAARASIGFSAPQQQLTSVRGILAPLEALDVGAYLGARGELDHSAAKHNRAAIAERAARVARGLVLIGRRCIGTELRP
jgi:hypothetical protein